MAYRQTVKNGIIINFIIKTNRYYSPLDNCDIAGFAEVNLKRWAVDLNSTPDTIEAALKGLDRGIVFSKDHDAIFLRNFLKHQKNLPLNKNNKAHVGILRRFELYRQKV